MGHILGVILQWQLWYVLVSFLNIEHVVKCVYHFKRILDSNTPLVQSHTSVSTKVFVPT